MISETKKKKLNPMLLNVLIVSGLVHLAAIIILGGITIVNYVIPDEAQFEEPPEVEEEQPPPETKVEIKPQAAPQTQALDNLTMKQVGDIAVDDVNVDLPGMEQSFTVTAGLGGFSSGSLLGGASGRLGIGMSDVSVFGLKTKAERILFAIDADRSMVTDAKGGLNSYRVIKEEISDMVGNLSTGTLFNVMVYDERRAKYFKPQLVPAGLEMTEALKKWIAPINATADDIGLEGDQEARGIRVSALSDTQIFRNLRRGNRQNENALLTQAVLEQQVDAVFIVTGYHRGFQRISRKMTPREREDWNRIRSSNRYQKQLAEHRKEVPEMRKRVAEKLAEINEERASRGMPPRVLASRNSVHSNANELNLKWDTRHPGWPPSYWLEKREMERYARDLIDVLYEDKGGEKPSINVILFLAGDQNFSERLEDNLDDYVDFFGGDYRVIRGEDEIKSARSAADTKNE